MSRHPLEEHAPDVTREIMGRLSPEAMRTLQAVSEMRHRPAEDVLREALAGYIADKLPRRGSDHSRDESTLLYPGLCLWNRKTVFARIHQ